MDREAAVKLWKEAGGGSTGGLSGNLPIEMVLEDFAHRVEAAERERCAKLCEERFSDGALEIADAIRKGPNE